MRAKRNGGNQNRTGVAPGADKSSEASNHLNGATGKTIFTEDDPLLIEVPCDRAGSFEPLPMAKHERRFTDFDDKIVAIYARGMTAREYRISGPSSTPQRSRRSSSARSPDAVMGEVTAW